MQHLTLLLPGLPLLSAVAVALLACRWQRRVARISVTTTLVTFILAALGLGFAMSGQSAAPLQLAANWGIFQLDPLAILMSMVIAGISLIVHLYSVRYMAEEAGYARFFMLLDLMTAALLLMVSAADLITLLVVWHLIGVLLYLLLGHDTRNLTAHRYAFWTLFTFRLGDLPLLLAAGLLFHTFGTWSLAEIFNQLNHGSVVHTVWGVPLAEVVGGLVALAAFARSAQIFAHTWLPYTMSGPTPVSALMHAGIVNAGGFLINRFAPLYLQSSDVLHWVFIVGLITAVIGSTLMLTQNDIKKSLGYSTMGQMGFMIMECGVGAFSLAVYHLIAHGVFKGTLFLGAGGVIAQARHDDGVPKHELYTFVVERRTARQRQPWLLMALITLVVPLAILATTHWLVAQNYFQEQGAIVLLFFGWVTGAQLIFATYKMRTTSLWRLVALMLISFTIVVIGYTVIAHAFELFLYPDAALRAQIYAAAGIDLLWFDILIGVVTLAVIMGWLLTYYADKRKARKGGESTWWLYFYTLISREFYLMDLYAQVARSLLSLSAKLNFWFRWA